SGALLRVSRSAPCMALCLLWLVASVAVASASNASDVPKEHERFFDFLMHTTGDQPELRHYLVRKLLLHLATDPWRPRSPCPRWRPQKRPAEAEAAASDEAKRGLLVVAMIAVPVEAFAWRRMVRATLQDLAGPLDLGHAWRRVSSGAEVRPRFAVGAHAGSALRSRVEREAAEFGDMAILNMTDSFETAGQNSEKTWLSFQWALQRYPDAQLIFHQDGDTVVDWRQALPRLLRAVLGPEVLSRPLEEEALQRLQLGRLCERTPTHLLAGCPGAVELEPCGAGSLYGFSGGGPPKSWGVRGSRATRLTSVGSPRS
ncbi:unnamed protein product, partial [Effrenium voratum]